jgi:hypothetical protein
MLERPLLPTIEKYLFHRVIFAERDEGDGVELDI